MARVTIMLETLSLIDCNEESFFTKRVFIAERVIPYTGENVQ